MEEVRGLPPAQGCGGRFNFIEKNLSVWGNICNFAKNNHNDNENDNDNDNDNENENENDNENDNDNDNENENDNDNLRL